MFLAQLLFHESPLPFAAATFASSSSTLKTTLRACLVFDLLCMAAAIKAYAMKTVVLDGPQNSLCQTKEFHVIEGLSGFIYSHEPYDQVSYRPNRNCFVVLQTLKDYQIRIEAVEFLVEGVPNQCKGDTLHLFDLDKPRTADATDGPGPIIGQICGKVKNRTLLATSTYNAMTLWWHTDSVLEKYKGGFILKWTAFRNSNGAGCSQNTEFQCGNGMCIPNVLACDDVLHCPDGSDADRNLKASIGCESVETDSVLAGLSTAVVTTICVACVFGCIFFCIGAMCCCRNCGKNGGDLQKPATATIPVRGGAMPDCYTVGAKQRYVPIDMLGDSRLV